MRILDEFSSQLSSRHVLVVDAAVLYNGFFSLTDYGRVSKRCKTDDYRCRGVLWRHTDGLFPRSSEPGSYNVMNFAAVWGVYYF